MTQLIFSALPNPRRPIVYIEPTLSVEDCVALMIKEDIGAVVVRSGETILGMVTERDIVRNCIAEGLDPKKSKAADIVFKDISILESNDPIEKAMNTITKTKRRHVLIREEDALIAILSIGDVMFHLLDDKLREIEHLENYIHS